jgi:DNA-binding winged helix-turn-helix (wHTH) protein/tetratricopeptide (TPR) repeat protein
VAVRFADVELDRDLMVLRRAGAEVAVEPQVFEVLAYLVEHRDRMVPKTELLDEIWGDRFVSESALSSRIKSARQAVGDNGRDQRVIRTVHGRGFRFVADVETSPDPAGREVPAPVEPGPDDATGGRWSADELPATVVAVLRSGRGATVEIVGPSGTARTDLLDDVLAAVADAGMVVGRGSSDLATGSGVGVVAAIDEWVQRRPELLDEIPPACAAELRAVLAGGEPSSRPRLALSARELVMAAGRSGGAALAIDNVHLVDAFSLDLVGHLARSVRHVPVVLLVTHRDGFRIGADTRTVRAADAAGRPDDVPSEVQGLLARAAVIGESIDPFELAAAAGLDPDAARRVIDVAVDHGSVLADGGRFRFADASVVEALTDQVPTDERRRVRRAVADALVAQGAHPERVADLLVAAGAVEEAGPHLVAAAFEAALQQLPGHVVQLTDLVDEVRDPSVRVALLELRADAFASLGLPEAVTWYRTAIREAEPGKVPWLRARLARSLMMANDLDGAVDALDGVEPTGEPTDGGILLIGGMAAYLQGDLDRAEELADAARALALAPGAPAAMLDVIALQGMIAHSRGEWFDRLRRELRFAADSRELASTVFDSHVCVAQYLLYGPSDLGELIELATELRAAAEESGSRPAAGFALTLEGEARMLRGDLEAARDALVRSVELHAAIGADTGHAHALQRLAEVELALGERASAERRLRQALALARWSPLSWHLLQRNYGTLIAAAPDPESAAAVVDEAAAVLDGPHACVLCQVMVSVPAAIALAEVGRLDDARRHLDDAAQCAARWDGPAWAAAVDEAAAVVARCSGDPHAARALLERALVGFEAAGQPLDAGRCREALDSERDSGSPDRA